METPEQLVSTHSTSLSTKLLCGAIAGVTGTCIIYPLDIVKTKVQNSAHGRSPFAVARQILHQDGVKGLYRGLPANILGIIPEKAIKLAANDYAREYLASRRRLRSPDDLSIADGMLAGGVAGFCQVVATTPMEITKINLQMRQKATSPFEMARELGLKGMYKGTAATLLRDVPFSLIFFPGSAYLKRKMGEHNNGVVTFTAVLASGVISGIFAAAIVTPADVVKTRLQTIGGKEYKGFAYCMSEIIRIEGPAALFKGAVQRTMITAPLFGIALLVYEAQQQIFAHR